MLSMVSTKRLCLMVFSLVFANGCEKPTTRTPSEPANADIVYAIERDIPNFTHYPANTQAVETVDIVARTRGFIEGIHFKDGQIVKQDQLLYTLEVIYDQADVEQAQAELAITKAKVTRTRLSYERQERLLAKTLTSKEERDKALLDFNEAVAERKRARALLAQAQRELSYTEVRAPFNGRISRTRFYPGELVDPDNANGSTTLTQMLKTSPLYVDFPIPSNDLQTLLTAQYQQGFALPVRFTLLSDSPIHTFGSLNFINNTADQQSGTILLRATISNQANDIYPGQYGTIFVQTGTIPNAILIPTTTIHEDFNGKYVYTVDTQQQLKRQNIKAVQKIDAWTQVQGLKANTPILAGGLSIVHPGLHVIPNKIPPPPAPVTAKDMSTAHTIQKDDQG
ncbi:Multidrug resistance protein MexA [BD1-7 clade bacterium]|uniref:Multidrug resistance protein MexA n=1 Tax=BD1-7 clade bacterium TaxID=2029982 RepID=A0A5S9QM31_9GAMM|nr:Multidrug resistance protein MexA [BD1-7 clade bacterium]CAA0116371.1 Multidrug resistance protein MexA [BD1-7 clade bacterium]CAA0120034.1 Multidrug resistance protein MexA [BD1-7 clade bacterium]